MLHLTPNTNSGDSDMVHASNTGMSNFDLFLLTLKSDWRKQIFFCGPLKKQQHTKMESLIDSKPQRRYFPYFKLNIQQKPEEAGI